MLSQLYKPCADMPDALQTLIDQLAEREQTAIVVASLGSEAAADKTRAA